MNQPNADGHSPLRIIHVGGRGRWPLEVLSADPRFQSVALVDVVPETLAAARTATNLPENRCFTSTEQALAAVDADALVICTPTATHARFCRAVEPGISGRNNLETLAVCEMAVRAATTRRPVERGEL